MSNMLINRLKERTPSPVWSYLTYTGCAISFLLMPFFPKIGRNIFYLCGYFAFFCFIFNCRYYTRIKFNLIAPSFILAFSLATVFWLAIFKEQGDYINIYRSYMSTSRLLIVTAFVLLIATNERLLIQRKMIIFCIISGLIINIYACYQSVGIKNPRIELSFDRATIVAYILTAVSLIMMQSILMLKSKYRLAFYALAFMLTYAAIIFTGTRAAMLLYPVLIIFSVLATKGIITHKHKIIIVLLLPVLLASSGLIFKKQIERRINDFERNVIMIDNTQVDNSVFSRLWMQIIAFRTGNTAPFGQSAEQRGKEAVTIIAVNPQLSNARRYLTVHLHNEVLETWSLKGIWGVVLLAGIYLSLLVSSFKPVRNAGLFSVTVALIAYGLSDVIFFSTEGTIMFSLALILSVLTVNKHPAKEI